MANRDRVIKVSAKIFTANSKQDYNGLFKLEKNILMFDGASIPASSITEVSNESIKAPLKLTWLSIILLIFGLLTTLLILALALLDEISFPLFLAFLYLIGYAIWERNRPPKYGITILLNTGDKRYFIHRQKVFIDTTYKAFVKALKEGRNYSANFNTIIIGSGAKVGSITGNNNM